MSITLDQNTNSEPSECQSRASHDFTAPCVAVPGSTVLPYVHTTFPSEWPSATINNERLLPAQRLNLRYQSVHHQSTNAISIYSQLPTVSGGRLFHPDPEDAPCHTESVVHNSRPTQHVRKLSAVGIVGCIHALHACDSLWED